MSIPIKPSTFRASAHVAIAIVLSSIAVAGPAQAHMFCVSTATQLQAALDDASDGGMYNGEDNYVEVVQGTYRTGAATGNAPFFFYSSASTHFLFISGGYSENCSSQLHRAALTVLDGRGVTGVLELRNVDGDIDVEDVTLENGESDEPGAGLQVNYLITVNASVQINRTIILDNHSTASGGGLYASAAGDYLFLQANLIAGNSADLSYGAGYVTGYGQFNSLYNNTVTGNTTTYADDPTGGLYCGGTTSCQIFNSIFWNNTHFGLYLGDAGAVLSHNDYGTLGGAAPAIDDLNLSVAPQFVDAANGDFHLAGDSPLLGYGLPLGSILDLDGNQFPFGGGLDLGAYSQTVFSDGFDN
ncbi:MAG: hypothetical protein WB784_06280 [Rhodanobacteraceae bacterium]